MLARGDRWDAAFLLETACAARSAPRRMGCTDSASRSSTSCTPSAPRAVGPAMEAGPGSRPIALRGGSLCAILLGMAVELLEWLAIRGEAEVFGTTADCSTRRCVGPRGPRRPGRRWPSSGTRRLGYSPCAAERYATHSRTDPAAASVRLHEALALLPAGLDASTERGRRRGQRAQILLRVRLADEVLPRPAVRDRRGAHLDHADALLRAGDVDPDLASRVVHHRAILACLIGDFDAAERILS